MSHGQLGTAHPQLFRTLRWKLSHDSFQFSFSLTRPFVAACPAQNPKTPRFSCRWGYVRCQPILSTIVSQPVWWNSIPFAAVEPLSKFTNTHTHTHALLRARHGHIGPFERSSANEGEWKKNWQPTGAHPIGKLIIQFAHNTILLPFWKGVLPGICSHTLAQKHVQF